MRRPDGTSGLSRRRVLAGGGAFAALAMLGSVAEAARPSSGSGPLRPDPAGILDLPERFRYTVLSRLGDPMSDTRSMPAHPDGMAAFGGGEGTTILIRNHELEPAPVDSGVFVPAGQRYDAGRTAYTRGGTTTLVVSRELKVLRSFASLGGTVRNCAGGPTPWGSWISCEETTVTPETDDRVGRRHGYCFEVSAAALEPVVPRPLVAMGRFRHEAVAVDPYTGIVYETEDAGDGCFYRFVPTRPGVLANGGVLEALRLVDLPQGVTVAQGLPRGVAFEAEWIRIPDPDPGERGTPVRAQGIARGAATMRNAEGAWWSEPDQAVYICATRGGAAGTGQIYRYAPRGGRRGGGTLQLFVESAGSAHPDAFARPDNITVGPRGDLVVCRDGPGRAYLWIVTAEGEITPLARNALNDTEFAGACFGPAGDVLFVNIYGTESRPGMTLAIIGPWPWLSRL